MLIWFLGVERHVTVSGLQGLRPSARALMGRVCTLKAA
jgi:hypothetical protein